MIKALLLIFNPGATWDRIVLARKTLISVLVLFFLPTVVLSIGGELWGLLQWGRRQEFSHELKHIPRDLAIYYGAAQLALSLVFVFLGALMIKGAGDTFHTRHTYTQCFTLVAYTLSPLFLVRVLDGFPSINPWITFGVGIILSIAALYSGIPRVMQPDPPHAFGLYLTGAVLLVIIGGLARLLTLLVLQGRLKLH
ncbi:MAG TPA: Yip1 family protein [Verrucomicrobiae bacterium]|jgi:hypothetical protein|nr:Yip1 family protein [Verrucomicrobiae bacterium]